MTDNLVSINQLPEKINLDNQDLLIVEGIDAITYKVKKQNAIPTILNNRPQATFSNVQLLLHGESSPIIDSSSFKRIITNNNCTVSTVQKKFGNSSILFNGTNSHLILPPIDILSGDFTVECEVFPLSLSGFRTIIGQWSQASGLGGWLLTFENNFDISFYFAPYSTSAALVSFRGGATAEEWQHLAVSRRGSEWFLYVQGILRSTARYRLSKNAMNVNISLGNFYNSSNTFGAGGATYLHAYLDEIRLTRQALYFLDSTQPTTVHPDL